MYHVTHLYPVALGPLSQPVSVVVYGLRHWLSLPAEDKPFEGRDCICLVHACITIPKSASYILGNSVNICWMNKKEARRMHSREAETELALQTVCLSSCMQQSPVSSSYRGHDWGAVVGRHRKAGRRYFNHRQTKACDAGFTP